RDVGISRGAPAVDLVADIADDILALALFQDAVEGQLVLDAGRRLASLSCARDGHQGLAGASSRNPLTGRLPPLVQFPVPGRLRVRRIDDRVLDHCCHALDISLTPHLRGPYILPPTMTPFVRDQVIRTRCSPRSSRPITT